MAEIRIERKGRGLGWLWLPVALVIVAILAWYFLYPGRSAPAPATGAPPTTGQHRPRAPIAIAATPAERVPPVAVRTTDSGGDHGEEG